MTEPQITEVEALRAYFDAHMNMHHASTEEAFARFYVKANLARDRLLEIDQEERSTPAHTCMNAGTSAGACKKHCGDKERCWGNTP